MPNTTTGRVMRQIVKFRNQQQKVAALQQKQKPTIPDNLTIYAPPTPPASHQPPLTQFHFHQPTRAEQYQGGPPPSFTAERQTLTGRARSPARSPARSAGAPRGAPAECRRAWQIDERAGEEEEDQIYDTHGRFEDAGGYANGGKRYSMMHPPGQRGQKFASPASVVPLPYIYTGARGRFQNGNVPRGRTPPAAAAVRQSVEYEDDRYADAYE